MEDFFFFSYLCEQNIIEKVKEKYRQKMTHCPISDTEKNVIMQRRVIGF